MNYCQFRNLTIKRMCNSKPLLPVEYQQVEYLQTNNSNANNYGENWIHINTGINYFADFETQCQNAENIGNVTCGCGDNSYGATLGRHSSSQPYYTFFSGVYNYYVTNVLMTTGGVFAWKNNNIYVNGVYVTQLTKPTLAKQFILYGCSYGTTLYAYKSIKIYYCKLWDNNGDLVRHYIPCYKKSDNTPGMYDIVNNTFNGGTGTSGYFSVGNNV